MHNCIHTYEYMINLLLVYYITMLNNTCYLHTNDVFAHGFGQWYEI